MFTRFVEQIGSPQALPDVSELDQFFPSTIVGSLSETSTSSALYFKHRNLSTGTNLSSLNLMSSDTSDLVTPVGHMYEHALQPHEVECLTGMYTHILSNVQVVGVSPLCRRFGRA